MKLQELSALISRRFKRVSCGIDTPGEFCLLFYDYFLKLLTGTKGEHYTKAITTRRKKDYLAKDCYVFKDIKLPLLSESDENQLFAYVVEDTYHLYLHYNDDCREETCNFLYDVLSEGPYALKNEQVDVQVRKNDIVIDAGSWVGDFAAYAAVKGATTYAFEPSDVMYEQLQKTAKLNGNIIPVKKGLGNKIETASIVHSDNHSLGDAILKTESTKEGSEIAMTTVDQFVADQKLERVDFIKSDIEGFERYLLMGATETMKRFAPKLAICTYHLPDDPQVLAGIIKAANPKYNIVQKRKKLYASVPDRKI